MAQERLNIDGACHCGNIRLTLGWPDSAASIPIRVCGCTFCQMRGGSWTSHPDATLEATIDDPARVSRYRFGTETADFYVCSVCGVVPFVVSEIDDRLYAVANVATLRGTEGLLFDRSSTDFDGEDTESRLERRQQKWIAAVRIQDAPAPD